MSLMEILQKRTEKTEDRRQEAIAEAKRLAALLRDRFALEAVYLTGSILSDKFRLHSDIDMIVKGLRSEDFFKAHAFLLKASAFDIDLKPFEDLTDDFKDKALSEGMKIG